jgi:c-di-GMP-binding flagellar brake protein YcgR
MDEHQRKLKRVQLVMVLPVLDRTSGDELGHLMDITTEGMGIRSRDEYTPGEVLEMRIALPDEILDFEIIEVEGRCMWVRSDDNPDLFRVGFQFENIMPDVEAVIDELIRRYQR